MSTVGNNSTSSNNSWLAYGVNTNDQIAVQITMSAAGNVTDLHAYFAGDGVNLPNCVLCLWSSTGTLLAQSSSFNSPSGSRTVNGQQWNDQSITPYAATNGQVLYVGYYRDHSTWDVFSYQTGTGTIYSMSTTSATPVNMSGMSTQTGSIGAYLGYTVPVTGGLKIWNGSAYAKHPVKTWNGSSWVRNPLKSWDGSAWRWRG